MVTGGLIGQFCVDSAGELVKVINYRIVFQILTSTINPSTRTTHLLNVNKNQRACYNERETSLDIVNTVSFTGLSDFF